MQRYIIYQLLTVLVGRKLKGSSFCFSIPEKLLENTIQIIQSFIYWLATRSSRRDFFSVGTNNWSIGTMASIAIIAIYTDVLLKHLNAPESRLIAINCVYVTKFMLFCSDWFCRNQLRFTLFHLNNRKIVSFFSFIRNLMTEANIL